MKLNQLLLLQLLAILIFSCGDTTNKKESTSKEETIKTIANKDTLTTPVINNLLYEKLEVKDSLEIILAYIHLPKQTKLPTHYHPGEEFAYVIEGSGELTLKDHSKTVIKAGEASKIPLKHIHSFRTMDEAAKLVVFRVHEQGQPHRFLVEEE